MAQVRTFTLVCVSVCEHMRELVLFELECRTLLEHFLSLDLLIGFHLAFDLSSARCQLISASVTG